MRRSVLSLSLLAGACAASPVPQAADAPLQRLCPDAGWCWFQDERAIVVDDHLVVFGSVANGRGDPARRGDVQITQWDLQSGDVRTVELHDRFQHDDHDAPALRQRGDGRILAVYCGHGKDDLVRRRISVRANDATEWQEERTLKVVMKKGRGVTYANLLPWTGGDGTEVLVDCFRGENWNPTVVSSSDDGEIWQPEVVRLIGGPGRPYAKYASDGRVLHVVASDQHPRNHDNGIYHGVLDGHFPLAGSDGSRQHDASNELSPDDAELPSPADLTRVFQGRPDAVAWPCDLELDRDGRPVCAFSVQVDGAGKPTGQGGMDHRYWYARFDGERWQAHEMAFAGTRLYAGEDDYTGLCAIVPDDPRTVFISTNAHPTSGAPLSSRADGRRHWEIWRGVTTDGGASFEWTPITADSTADNLRPIVPRWRRDRCVLLWLRGEYRSYTDYDQEAVGLVLPLPE